MHVTTRLHTPMLTYPEVDVALAARHDEHGGRRRRVSVASCVT